MKAFQIRQIQNLYIVSVSGRLHQETARELKPALSAIVRRESPPRLILELSVVESINGLGLGVLIYALKRVLKKEGELVLAGLQPRPALFFELTRADQVFPVYANLNAALDCLLPCPKP